MNVHSRCKCNGVYFKYLLKHRVIHRLRIVVKHENFKHPCLLNEVNERMRTSGGKGLEEMNEKPHRYFTMTVWPLCHCQNFEDIKENGHKL